MLFSFTKYSLVWVIWLVSCKTISLRAKWNYRAVEIINYIQGKLETFNFWTWHLQILPLPTKEVKSYNLPPHGIIIALKTLGLGRELIGDIWFNFLSHSMPFEVMKATYQKKNRQELPEHSGAEQLFFHAWPLPLAPQLPTSPSISSSLSAPQTICHGSDETICHGLVHLNVCVIVEAVTGKA